MGAYESLEALADPTRREIFERLAERAQPVGELAAGLPVSRPAVSQHLKVLREAALVSVVPSGSRRIYRVESQGVQALRSYLDVFWKQSLASFKTAAEQTKEQA